MSFSVYMQYLTLLICFSQLNGHQKYQISRKYQVLSILIDFKGGQKLPPTLSDYVLACIFVIFNDPWYCHGVSNEAFDRHYAIRGSQSLQRK